MLKRKSQDKAMVNLVSLATKAAERTDQQVVNCIEKNTEAKVKNIRSRNKNIKLGYNLNVGDLIFGEGEIGFIRRKFCTKYGYMFELRITSLTEILVMQFSSKDFFRNVKSGIWKYYSV